MRCKRCGEEIVVIYGSDKERGFKVIPRLKVCLNCSAFEKVS